jgi:hypothetical protein
LARKKMDAKYIAIGGVASPLGLPRSRTTDIRLENGIYTQAFRGGDLLVRDAFSTSTATSITRRVAKVWFTGVECIVRTEEDSGDEDEIYGTLGCAIPSFGGVKTYSLFGDDDGNWGNAGEDAARILRQQALLYEGPPNDLIISGTLVEHDEFGSIADIKAGIKKAIEDAAKVYSGLLGFDAEDVANDDNWFKKAIIDVFTFVLKPFIGEDKAFNPDQIPIAADDFFKPMPRHTLRRDDDPKTLEYTHRLYLTGVENGQYAMYINVELFDVTPVEQ